MCTFVVAKYDYEDTKLRMTRKLSRLFKSYLNNV